MRFPDSNISIGQIHTVISISLSRELTLWIVLMRQASQSSTTVSSALTAVWVQVASDVGPVDGVMYTVHCGLCGSAAGDLRTLWKSLSATFGDRTVRSVTEVDGVGNGDALLRISVEGYAVTRILLTQKQQAL